MLFRIKKKKMFVGATVEIKTVEHSKYYKPPAKSIFYVLCPPEVSKTPVRLALIQNLADVHTSDNKYEHCTCYTGQ